MTTPVRRFALGLLALAALECGLAARPAEAALHPQKSCLSRLVCAEAAEAVIRAGQITVVQTTLALVRVIKHEALAQDRAAAAARPGAR